MALNMSALFGVIDKQKRVSKSKGGTEWIYRSKLQQGDYHIRFLGNDLYCPHGVHIHTVHELQKVVVQDKWAMTPEEREKSYYRVLCTESYAGRDDDGKLRQACPVCDFCADFVSSMTETDQLELLDPDLAKAIDEMSSNECRRLVYPVLIRASQTTLRNDKGKEVKVWIPDPRNTQLAILSLSAQNYESNADLTLAKKIASVALSDPTNIGINSGRWFVYSKKSNSQDLTPAEKGELTAQERDLLKNFPKVNTYGQSDEGRFAKNYKCGYAKGLQYVKQTWVYPIISQQHDYTVDGLVPGQV